MKVLVTGASGAVGSNLAKALLERGDEVVSIRHDERPIDCAKLLGVDSEITWARGDITDESLVKRVLADYEISMVYHLAALPIVKMGTRTTRPIFETNLMGTLSVLEAIKEATAAKFDVGLVYLATDKVYGETDWGRAYKETDPLNAMAPYETSKACADMTCRMFHKMSFIKKLVVIRPSNMYGPGDFNSRIIPNTIKRCLRGSNPILFKDLVYVREFTYFKDAVRAFIELGDSLMKPTFPTGWVNGETFNVGSGQSRTQEQVVTEILRQFPNLKPELTEPEPHFRIEIPYQTLDHTKLAHTIGWEPWVSFETGIKVTIEWWRLHPELWSTESKRNLGF